MSNASNFMDYQGKVFLGGGGESRPILEGVIEQAVHTYFIPIIFLELLVPLHCYLYIYLNNLGDNFHFFQAAQASFQVEDGHP